MACEPFLAPFIAKEQIHINRITRPSHTSARGLGKISCTIGLGVIGLPQLFVIYKGLVHPINPGPWTAKLINLSKSYLGKLVQNQDLYTQGQSW